MSTTGLPSFIAVVVEIFALQFSSSVVDAGDFDAKLVYTPADPPFATARWLALFALEEALLVTVGNVQRESKDLRSVFHGLDDII